MRMVWLLVFFLVRCCFGFLFWWQRFNAFCVYAMYNVSCAVCFQMLRAHVLGYFDLILLSGFHVCKAGLVLRRVSLTGFNAACFCCRYDCLRKLVVLFYFYLFF